MTKTGITFYMHVHQPYRVRQYSVFDTAFNHDYFDGHGSPQDNEAIFKKVAEKSYRPMNKSLDKLLKRHPEFKFSISITGTFIEQAAMWAPDVLESFQRLVATGRVEVVAETYYHSLAFFYDRDEFERQVESQIAKIKDTFGVKPTAFRNTELAYNNDLAKWAEEFGFKAIIAEGWDPVLEWRSPNFVYRPDGTKKIGLLLKNYQLSDDIAFRFSNRGWSEWPLTADKFNQWVQATPNEPLINLFMDYETFGEHQWEDTGIFDFFEEFVSRWLDDGKVFHTITSAVKENEAVGELNIPQTITWADSERDLSAWLGNKMQQEALTYIYNMADDILRTGDLELISDWRKLQTSDHFYYMSSKYWSDGDVHTYFSPYESPYDAFLYYLNAIRDLRFRLHSEHRIGGLNG